MENVDLKYLNALAEKTVKGFMHSPKFLLKEIEDAIVKDVNDYYEISEPYLNVYYTTLDNRVVLEVSLVDEDNNLTELDTWEQAANIERWLHERKVDQAAYNETLESLRWRR